VLVVGGGNTGFQIAEELAGRHEVHLSIGSRQMPLPQRVLGRDLFDLLTGTGLMAKTSSRGSAAARRGRETLIGSSRRKARGHGIRLRARTTAASGAGVTFADGTCLAPATVIWATGFRRDDAWIDVPVFDERGRVVHERGLTAAPGLSFLGMSWQHTRGSALLGWVGDDAAHLAEHIARVPAGAPALV
jgi:putative flavoprotein involved in K+ transport